MWGFPLLSKSREVWSVGLFWSIIDCSVSTDQDVPLKWAYFNHESSVPEVDHDQYERCRLPSESIFMPFQEKPVYVLSSSITTESDQTVPLNVLCISFFSLAL